MTALELGSRLSAKVRKGEILVHFNEIFDALSKVCLLSECSLN